MPWRCVAYRVCKLPLALISVGRMSRTADIVLSEFESIADKTVHCGKLRFRPEAVMSRKASTGLVHALRAIPRPDPTHGFNVGYTMWGTNSYLKYLMLTARCG